MTAFDIDILCSMVHETSKEHGWWPENKSAVALIPEKIALIHSELSEALECYRNDEFGVVYKGADDKPEGFGVELADAIIRICDLYEAVRLELYPELPGLTSSIDTKHEYNTRRPFRHGNKKA